MNISIIKLDKELPTPKYAHQGDAGMDLYSSIDHVLKPMERKAIPTGLKIAVPPGYEAQIRPRSGLAVNHGLSMVNTPGTIDSNYRGEIGVICINLGDAPITIKRGMKIAQMVINKVETAELVEVENLDDTTRGANGFGSTGH